ncbi:MAG: DUF2934 domain-containing protein [Allorhizobium sp.]
MQEFDTEWIAKRAYALWEEEGRPDGRHDAHWQQAAEAFRALQESANITTANAERRIRRAQPLATEREQTSKAEAPGPDGTRGKTTSSRGRRKE